MFIEARSRSPDTSAWWMLAFLAILCVLASAAAGFRLALLPAIAAVAGLALLGMIAVFGHVREQPRLAAGATAFLQMSLFTVLGVVLAFALAAHAGPLWDAELAALDRALGFDWPAFFRAADAAPALVWIGGAAYHSLTLQMVVGIVVLSGSSQFRALRHAVTAAILSGIVTILISGLMPALGNTFDPARYVNLWPSVAWSDRDLITGLRDGSQRTLDLTHLTGIVSFPSYHATLPLILAWAQRHTPVMRLLAPAWAALTILATPLFGGHYAVDVIGGLILGVAAIAVAPWIVRRAAQLASPAAVRTLLAGSLLDTRMRALD